jgi:DNA polymerase-3 subunit delta
LKLDGRDFAGLLRDASRVRAVLLHGPDAGLVRERGQQLAQAAAGSLDDPFRFAELTRPDPGTLALEASALSFSGGRRVLRIRDATDSLATTLGMACRDRNGSLIILEGGELLPRSKLRGWAEKEPLAASIACYAEEGAALKTTLRGLFEAEHVAVTPDALDWLVQHAGSDRGIVRSEVEKLALFAGADGRIDVETAQRVAGDQADLSLDDALFASTATWIVWRAWRRRAMQARRPVTPSRPCVPRFSSGANERCWKRPKSGAPPRSRRSNWRCARPRCSASEPACRQRRSPMRRCSRSPVAPPG